VEHISWSWEGHEQAKLEARLSKSKREPLNAQKFFSFPTEKCPIKPAKQKVARAVAEAPFELLSISIGGRQVCHPHQFRPLHTHASMHELGDDNVEGRVVSHQVGYGLKALAGRLGVSYCMPKTFSDLYGKSPEAGKRAHESPEDFHDWVKYATNDAELTYKVFENLKHKLANDAWCSQVHQHSTEIMLETHGLAKEVVCSAPLAMDRSMCTCTSFASKTLPSVLPIWKNLA